jgi:hypothetical protein
MTSAAPDGSTVPMSQSMMVDTFIPPYQLTPTMDIFAAGYGSFHCTTLTTLHLLNIFVSLTDVR